MAAGAERSAVKILVVDDNPDMLVSTRLLLTRAGFQVETAANGALALQAQRERPCAVLVTDLLMPETDGIETIEQFRRQFPAVKIIAMSGGGMRVKGEKYLSTAAVVGADALLKKPFEPGQLLETLRRVLQEGGPGV